MFELDPQLARDCLLVGDAPLSRVLAMNDKRFPWVILVPRRQAISEIHELTNADAQSLIKEIRLFSKILKNINKVEKINAGALGNLVPQLHVHIVGRTKSDSAWPGPVWGSGKAEPYDNDEAAAFVRMLASELAAS